MHSFFLLQRGGSQGSIEFACSEKGYKPPVKHRNNISSELFLLCAGVGDAEQDERARDDDERSADEPEPRHLPRHQP